MNHTRQEFIAKWQHELAGMILDAAVAGRTGEQLAVFVRNMMKLLDARLGQMYDWLAPPPAETKPTANGAAQPVRK